MLLFDAHRHLPDTGTGSPVQIRVVCGTREADWDAVLAQAATDPHVIPMLGLHPWFVATAAPGWEARLDALLRAHRTGVGECGLDFAREAADRPAQEQAFRLQLRLAHALHRPVAIHAVRAWGRLLDLLREEGVPPAGALVHAFSGSPETVSALQAMGIFLSFSAEGLAPARTKIHEVLRAVPSSHLLLETDDGGDLERVIATAAVLRGVAAEDLAARTWKNGLRCFKELMA
ncbi:MAG: TatD family hydrolase [Geothrix sp.]|uniref:TatD family hydrolase n=1 Tax=Geothrix sp. TaxID=1962974 RepID=UPI0017DDE2F9|nr:TatD family hydrolase [Geothrix sp.]NWJ40338.1 TatD family hydrolase [Geothrix sp.]WIL21656.1 MAG: TatD family hydrolase [Geothrix sp.]